MDKFYPLYALDQVIFYLLAFFLVNVFSLRRLVSLDKVNAFLDAYNKIFKKAFLVGGAVVLIKTNMLVSGL